MYTPTSPKVYVVFEGRNPGIYWSWVDCDVQVNGFKGNKHKSFDTYEEAEAEWLDYCGKRGGGLNSSDGRVHRQRDITHRGNHSRAQWQQGMGRINSHFAEDTDSDVFIIQPSMQKQLTQLCSWLRIDPPTYTFHQVKVINGHEYKRYYASLPTGVIGRPAVSLGQYAGDDYGAKEDVAALLLRRLLAATGRRIRDLNYYNVQLLEEELQKIMDKNMELEMEISILNEELRLVETQLGEV